MTCKFQHVVTFVEGHRIFENEELINQAALLIWIHTPSQVRKMRSPACKSKSDAEWASQLRSEVEYFEKIKPLVQRFPVCILSGLQTRAFNTLVIMGIVGLYLPNIPRKRLVCYREFALPDPEDLEADQQRCHDHSPHERTLFSAIFRSKLYSLPQN